MATVKSALYTYQEGSVQSKAPIGDLGGRLRVIKFDYTPATDILAIGDIIKLCKLPKGAKVLDANFSGPSWGTVGIFDWGYAASAELDSAGSAVEAADDDAFSTAAAIDLGGQAAVYRMVGGDAAYLKEFAAEVDVQLVMTEASDSASGDAIKGHIVYVID